MGAGQIGGIATLLDMDFNNAPGFLGTQADITDGHHIVYYLSHAMLFCVGALIEAHVVLTPATCVFGERYKFDVFGATHKFLEGSGVSRTVEHMCLHRDYNHTTRWGEVCTTANIAILVLGTMFSFHNREAGSEFVVNRVRYGTSEHKSSRIGDTSCHYYGWGSRRNGYLIPLLIYIRRVDVVILPSESCSSMWDNEDHYLCIAQQPCKSEEYGALCPDDMGSIIICGGFAQGMMTSRLVDRPCGVGFLDLSKFNKFLTCAVDDSRDVIDHDDDLAFDFTTESSSTIALITPPPLNGHSDHDHDHTERDQEKQSTTPKQSDEKDDDGTDVPDDDDEEGEKTKRRRKDEKDGEDTGYLNYGWYGGYNDYGVDGQDGEDGYAGGKGGQGGYGGGKGGQGGHGGKGGGKGGQGGYGGGKSGHGGHGGKGGPGGYGGGKSGHGGHGGKGGPGGYGGGKSGHGGHGGKGGPGGYGGGKGGHGDHGGKGGYGGGTGGPGGQGGKGGHDGGHGGHGGHVGEQGEKGGHGGGAGGFGGEGAGGGW